MGLFDNVLKSLDDTLKAIEDGAIEKKITDAVDALDRVTEKAPEQLEKIVDAPQNAMRTLDSKSELLGQKAQDIRFHAQKTIDIIQRPES